MSREEAAEEEEQQREREREQEQERRLAASHGEGEEEDAKSAREDMSREEAAAKQQQQREEERRLAASHGEEDDAKSARIYLPLDLVLRIITYLPSPLLFEHRLSKATHEAALLALAQRPFFFFQQTPPVSLCFLLPLDSPSTPLPCPFRPAKPSFLLTFAHGNLLCLRRQYPSMLDICICSVFRRWKVTLPPIVHPDLAPRLLRRVFFEDGDVDSLSVVGFHVQPNTHAAHAHQGFSPEYRIFVASNTYLRVYDSGTQQWSSRLFFPSHCSRKLSGNMVRPGYVATPKPPECFATFDGNLILNFSSTTCALFMYADQSFHDMGLPFHPNLELAGYPVSVSVDRSFVLRICLPHVESHPWSSYQQGLELKELCRSDLGLGHVYSVDIFDQWFSIGGSHSHTYERRLLRSHCFAHQDKIYALLVECEEMQCTKERAMRRTRNVEWHSMSKGDIEMMVRNHDGEVECDQFFPRRSSYKSTLYSASIDTTNWTLHIRMEADASAFLKYLGLKDSIPGKLLLG